MTSKSTQNDPDKPHLRLVTVLDGQQQVEAYDHVILACHSDMALDILRGGNISDAEERILRSFKWTRNDAVLHSDISASRYVFDASIADG